MKKSADAKNTGLHLLENKLSGQDTISDPISYLKAVKNAFPKESNKYKEFEGLLLDHKAQRIDLATLEARVKEFLREHESLLLGFNAFLPKDHKNSLHLLAALFTDSPDLQLESTQLLPDCRAEASLQNPNDSVGDNAGQDGVRDKDFEKHRPDIQDCERCTPSYCLLPEDYPLASRRTEDDDLVLNVHLVAVPSGSKNRPFENTRKNEYERSLFRCEDDQFELDMQLETVTAAIVRVETLLKDVEKGHIPICLEDHLTAGDIRSIERLYGEDGLDVLDCLRRKPSVVLPVVLTRLKQKKEEWGKCRTDFNVTWAEVHAKYHHRSLDYRSSDFKNRDMKSLSTKALLAEIEKKLGKESKNGPVLACLCDGKEQNSLISQLELEYSDPDIHNDIYHLIKYSCVRWYRQEHMDIVMNILKHFLEPMLGVPTRPDDTDAPSEAEESAHTLSNEGIESTRKISDDGDSDGGVPASKYSDGEKRSDEDPDEDVNDNKAEETDVEYNGLLLFTECCLHKAKLVTKCLPQSSERDSDSRLFYGNASFYVLLVLHYILYGRLQKAKLFSSSTANTQRIGDDTGSADRYARFMSALYNLLGGSFDQEKFEDECLAILGPESYILFTLDKLIFRIVKQLHGIATSDINRELIQIYAHESARKPWTSMDNNNYIENVRRLLSDKIIFRLEFMPAAARLSIQIVKLCVDEADKEGYDGDGDD